MEENSRENTVVEMLIRFRNQALCIKTNIQALKDIWNLQSYFREKNTGAFYKIIQDNCIFRIVLETYKMLYDSISGSITISKMANDCYNEMKEMDEFKDLDLLSKKKKFSSDLRKFSNIDTVIKSNRNRVYAHNGSEFHWFSDLHTELWGMTDEIYDSILDMSNICIQYCNDILVLFHKKPVYEYSNHDDIKRLFGIRTEHDQEAESLNQLFFGKT